MIKVANRQRGFTLVELLIVIGIIGVMFLTLLPRYSRFLSSKKLDAATRQMVSDLRWAHQAAMAEHINYAVRIYTNDETYIIGNNKTVNRKLDVDIVSVSPDSTITFYPKGDASAATTITLESDEGKTLEIGIAEATGRVKIQ